jgi:hypothetical protein
MLHTIQRAFAKFAIGAASCFFGSCSNESASPDLEHSLPPEFEALRGVVGPSPWAAVNRTVTTTRGTFHFIATAPGNGDLAGLTSVQNSEGATLLILDFISYLRVLDNGDALLWRARGEKESRRLLFDVFSLASLAPIADPLAAAALVRANGSDVSPIAGSEHWEMSPFLAAGAHRLSLPHDWSRFTESLVLSGHANVSEPGKRADAILAFNWHKHELQIFPQDWLNDGRYEVGYQWLTRAARQPDGAIVGDGIRIGCFELDETNRQIKRWLVHDSFYMPQ